MPTQEEIQLLQQVLNANANGQNSTDPMQQALETMKQMQQNGQVPSTNQANDSINQAMDALRALQNGQAPTNSSPQANEKMQDTKSATDALNALKNAGFGSAAQPQATEAKSAVETNVDSAMSQFHTMLSAQGLQMQGQAGFDYTGALSNDGELSTAESVVMFAQFAGKLEDEGHLNNRFGRKPIADDVKAQTVSALENYLGDKADALDVISEKEMDAMIKLLSMPENYRSRVIMKAMQDPEVQELRELPKNDKISAVFHIPASEGQEEVVIDLNNPKKTETQAYVEVDSKIYTPDDGPDFG